MSGLAGASSPGSTTPGYNGKRATATSAQHVTKITEAGFNIKHRVPSTSTCVTGLPSIDTLGKHSLGLQQFCPGYGCTSYAPRACTVSTWLRSTIQHRPDRQHMEMHQSDGEHQDQVL